METQKGDPDVVADVKARHAELTPSHDRGAALRVHGVDAVEQGLWQQAAPELGLVADEDAGGTLEILNRIKSGTARLDHSPKRGRIVPELLKHAFRDTARL